MPPTKPPATSKQTNDQLQSEAKNIKNRQLPQISPTQLAAKSQQELDQLEQEKKRLLRHQQRWERLREQVKANSGASLKEKMGAFAKRRRIRQKIKGLSKQQAKLARQMAGRSAKKWAWGAMGTILGFLAGWLYLHFHWIASFLAPFFSQTLADFFVPLRWEEKGILAIIDFIILIILTLIFIFLSILYCFFSVDTIDKLGMVISFITGGNFIEQCFQ